MDVSRAGLEGIAGLAIGGAAVLSVVLWLAVVQLARHYRRECFQLRARNAFLSAENDRWHEDFAAQAGELTALRMVLPAIPAQSGRDRNAGSSGGPGAGPGRGPGCGPGRETYIDISRADAT